MSENIYKTLRAGGLSHVGACALMGNFEAESGLKSNNLQNTFEKSGISDEVYTLAVDNDLYRNFVNDQAGYGLAQWTHPDRKRKLLDFVESLGASIGDENAQLKFALQELEEDYAELCAYLCSVDAELYKAVSRICKEYERPAVNNISLRYAYAQKWDQYFSLNAVDIPEMENREPEPEKLDLIILKLDEILLKLGA